MSIHDKVLTIIAEMVKRDSATITSATKISDLAHDSIELFELFVRFENELGSKLTYEEIAHIETIQDVIDFVENKKDSLAAVPSPVEEVIAR